MIPHQSQRVPPRGEPSLEFRTPPGDLSIGQLAAELLWLSKGPAWCGQLGDWARARRNALKAELRAREHEEETRS
jgi:hypothetical protein